MVQVLALEEDARPAGMLGEALGLGQQRRPAGVVPVELLDLGHELRVRLGRGEGGFQFVQRSDEGFRHPAPAELAEVRAGGIAQAAAGQEGVDRFLCSLLGPGFGGLGHGRPVLLVGQPRSCRLPEVCPWDSYGARAVASAAGAERRRSPPR